MAPEHKTKVRHYLHSKVKRKIYVYLIIFFIMLIISVYDIAAKYINPLLAVSGWLLGIGLGYLSGRVYKLIWHEESETIMTQRDTKGILVLIVYIAFSLSRRWLFQHWINGAILTAFIFCIVAGSRFGRILSIRRKIKRLFEEQGIFFDI
jgi:hypothetical protein